MSAVCFKIFLLCYDPLAALALVAPWEQNLQLNIRAWRRTLEVGHLGAEEGNQIPSPRHKETKTHLDLEVYVAFGPKIFEKEGKYHAACVHPLCFMAQKRGACRPMNGWSR